MANRGNCKECGELRILDTNDCCDFCGEGLTGEEAGLIIPLDEQLLTGDYEDDGNEDIPYM